jgi:hypothetical protein
MKIKLVTLSKNDFKRIKIHQEFLNAPPKPEKLIHKMLKFSRESELDDIIVDKNMYLIDGYCSYLIAQQVGVKFVKIKQVRV